MAERELIYLVATAGHPNYGDELIAAGWLCYLAERRPDADVWIDCAQPGRAAVLLAGIHPRLQTTDTCWRVAWQADGPDRDAAHARARELVAKRGTPREDLGIELATDADTIHLLGGGHLSSLWPPNLLIPTIVSELVRISGAPAHATGMSLLPVDGEDVGHLRDALGDLTIAEASEARTAEQFGLEIGIDDAFLALATDQLRIDARPAPRGMLLLHGDLHERGALDRALDQALAAFKAEGLDGQEIGVVEAIPPDDSWLLDAARERWGAVRMFSFAEVWQQGLAANADQVWITSRFHAHLVAAAQGARGLAVNTGLEYYQVKHRSLLAQDSGWELVDAAQDWPAIPPAGTFPRVAARLADRKRSVADRLYPTSTRKRGLFGR
ncbi:polysaccharide pyruvyl transferase family protein [Demequina sp. NBRC 110053]|uniref:polysaccharide pyruvyl transferase family protein n=1 Tax=Demequina sp. NBRC 110053 TaxID=1570342 RepID=UPI000A05C54A|nr:polysaccharide pyruvyl transferase family protein [Demequina sp. NBRC 110053]